MNTKLKCLLLDDELPGLAYLKMLCEQIPGLDVVRAFNDPQFFIEEFSSIEFDFCILDIEMPAMNGLQVAALLKGKPVIFTTAYKEYAAEAFDIDAVDYVRKPVKKERLLQAVSKVRERLERGSSGQQFIQLNTDQGKALVYFDQVCYIKTSDIDSRDKSVLTFDNNQIVLKNISFERLQELLPTDRFVRINKKEMINLKVVQVFSLNEITTTIVSPSKESLKLILSDTYRKTLSKKCLFDLVTKFTCFITFFTFYFSNAF
ncbi:LytR/AlgR family response regulator transcription factor [Niabella ginsengisoli]|uniref:Response regulator transcription factor n=1 Tax=Niabella ginsengisoli TaxID=522298 RepID=A0ABS9SRE7_9BACT|nr:response regulator transcription factor [Niabella ginsengisoli]MCH5600836.1 response regulator transcription factor [Niabella ginsengisoli]